ncbi:hypothetical protein RUM43_001919, partial [Polyplax serrata]
HFTEDEKVNIRAVFEEDNPTRGTTAEAEQKGYDPEKEKEKEVDEEEEEKEEEE